MMQVEIDDKSGFCFGVTTAIRKAEEELASASPLFCLGDIVHNGRECERLRKLGLETVEHADLDHLHDAKVLLRAHGEPPQTYDVARRNNLQVIDATCPVVLNLQRRIKTEYTDHPDTQIVIYGKPGHAEVVGLVGQTEGHAIVIENLDDAQRKIDFGRPVSLYSQTTKPLDGFREIVQFIEQHIQRPDLFHYYDTICRQVANRIPNIRDFARHHDVILFVCGRKSSNGRVLYNECLQVNPHTHLVETPSDIDRRWFENAQSVGICGATSTPKWLMEQCREAIDV
ncbi:MAG: 4-hydroxy-3-methylbut-2-enyl diphosphate reductase [Bacteroidaceae bacterium]|nr:4-hydroxy-3-methylbut-2-enyl diphosphate reductase [Bacteroidaceae bacterium]